ncbi:MAG: type III pantothenate kinase [Candidatus Promineifilaceae bacterium]|nr:type III pantothenate kinase [Candidatus Promineifilaceae bacterium]
MLLAIDIGNSNITVGIWDDQVSRKEWRLQTMHHKTADEYGLALVGLMREEGLAASITGVILSSVVPALTQTFVQLCHQILNLEPVIVNAEIDLGITIRTDNPQEVGADRLVNAVAAFHMVNSPCIVIDMGTATTFDVISASGELLGVAIAPGLSLAANALISQAARLSQVPLVAPPQAIGRNTTHAVQSGLIYGYVSLVEGMVNRLISEHPDRDSNILVLGTGGLIHLIFPYTEIIDQIEPWLTLIGLRIIYQRINH